MKKLLLLGAVILATMAGCTTQNPQYTPIAAGQPETNTVPRYIANADYLNSLSNRVSTIATGLAPANPYAGITDVALRWGFGLTALVSGLVATKKSNQAGGFRKALVAAVQGVENSTKEPTTSSAAVKASILSHAKAAGVEESVLGPIVRSVT